MKISNLNPQAFIGLFSVSACNIIFIEILQAIVLFSRNFLTRSAEGRKV